MAQTAYETIKDIRDRVIKSAWEKTKAGDMSTNEFVAIAAANGDVGAMRDGMKGTPNNKYKDGATNIMEVENLLQKALILEYSLRVDPDGENQSDVLTEIHGRMHSYSKLQEAYVSKCAYSEDDATYRAAMSGGSGPSLNEGEKDAGEMMKKIKTFISERGSQTIESLLEGARDLAKSWSSSATNEREYSSAAACA